MKISCSIIRDLLPLYHDNVCSKESSELVEEHIKNCQGCKSELEKFNIETKGVNYMNQKANIEEAKPINAIAKKWKRDKKVSFLLGTGVVSILGCVFSILAYQLSPNYIADDGMLVESFGFIPLTYLFGLIAIISIFSLGLMSMMKYFKLK